MALLLKADGEVQTVTPTNGKTWTLNELQAFVGGYIEIAHPNNMLIDGLVVHVVKNEETDNGDMILVLDEEGLLKEKPVNALAWSLYEVSPIVGDVLYCKSEEVE